MYPSPISLAVCWAGIAAGRSITEQLPTVSSEANSSRVSNLGSEAMIRIWPSSKIINVQLCSDRLGTINTKDCCSKRNGFLMMVYQEKIVPPGSLPVLASEPPDVLLSQRTWPWMLVWIAAVAVIFGLIGAPLIR